MTQNVLQAIGDADQAADDGAPAATQDARALLDHLNSTLGSDADEGRLSADSLPSLIRKAVGEVPSFGNAAARQADQIQHLIAEVTRLNGDTQVAGLRDVRDLCGVLNDVVLRMKQDASEVAGKIGLLTGAVTIIGGAADPDAPCDIAAILDSAKTAAARMTSLESLLKDAGAAIAALGENASSSQNKVRDLSAGLARLNTHAEADRTEIAKLSRRLTSADQSLAQGLASVDASIESERNEIARLHQRIASTDRDCAQGLAALDERATVLGDGLGRMQERLEFVENSAAVHACFQEKIEGLGRRLEETHYDTAAELNSLRLQEAERFSALINKLEALERKNEILSQDAEHMAARLHASEQKIASLTQRQKALSTWHDRMTHVLLASPELETD